MADPLIDGIGLWLERQSPEPPKRAPALFLDRDGVIVEEAHYLGKAENVRVLPRAARAIRTANEEGRAVIVVTNQSGIGRGFYDWPAFTSVQAEMIRQLAEHRAAIDATLACGFHENGLGALKMADHPWRKPRPGMILAAAERFGLSLANALIVGDKLSDLEAGAAAGLRRGALVDTGYGAREAAGLAKAKLGSLAVFRAPDLADALTRARADGW